MHSFFQEVFTDKVVVKRYPCLLAYGMAPIQCLAQVTNQKRIDFISRYSNRVRGLWSLAEAGHQGGAQRTGSRSRVKDMNLGFTAEEHVGHEGSNGARCQELAHLNTAYGVQARGSLLAEAIDCHE